MLSPRVAFARGRGFAMFFWLTRADNAIPIQGWINDPTDNDLMHLVPLLEGLQYVHDVRALLALRGGEEGQHTA